ncbi:MAG: spore maturation protein [Phycisphaerae bacterium]|jgi:spore maturation protein SpmB
MSTFLSLAQVFSQWAIPGIILAIILAAWWRRVPMYESFVTGAKEGFEVAVMIIPYLVAILSIIAVFRASGAMEDLQLALGWVLGQVGAGHHADKLELLPLALIRPLSGSGARGMLLDIFKTHDVDSFLGYAASVMQGSTETTFYVLTVYFGAVNVKRLRHTLPACLLGELAGVIAAIFFAAVFYRSTR